LTGFWSNNVSLGAKGRRGRKELAAGPLLLFNPLWDDVVSKLFTTLGYFYTILHVCKFA
jgi:hypothetical protein